MEFNTKPINKLLKTTNEDYDIELLWYDLKNLFTTYFKNLKINEENIYNCVEQISEKLNKYQENKQFLNIYIEIYNFIIVFLDNYVEFIKKMSNHTIELYNYQLMETWLSRYNKIDYIKKVGLPDTFKVSRNIMNIDRDNKIYYKFVLIKFIIENKCEIELLNLFDKDIFLYLDRIIELNNNKLFDMLATKYNLQEYYNYKNINKKYLPIKLIKYKKFNNFYL